MVTRIKYQLGLQDAVFDETTRINQEIYRGTLDMLSRTRCVARCVNLRTTAGQDTYILDHGILALVDVEDGARTRARRDQATADGWPYATVVIPSGGSVVDPGYRTFTLIRSDVLRVAPVPTEDGSVQVWAVVRPQKMDSDDDDLGTEQFGAIPDEYQDAVELYALWKCAAYANEQVSTYGERFRIQYEGQDGRTGRLFQIRQSVNRRGTSRAPSRRISVALSYTPDRGYVIG
jgi:hypothetical protein